MVGQVDNGHVIKNVHDVRRMKWAKNAAIEFGILFAESAILEFLMSIKADLAIFFV